MRCRTIPVVVEAVAMTDSLTWAITDSHGTYTCSDRTFRKMFERLENDHERNRAIRAVVAAQWAAACAIAQIVEHYDLDAVLLMPTPEQIVDGA